MDNFGEKVAECKYCKAKDLFWSIEKGRWMLIESYGLPHSCKEKHEHFSKLAKERNEGLKKQYQEEKDRLNTLSDNSPCPKCPGLRLLSYPQVCYYCGGSGKLTKKAKNIILYKLRKRLWPEMFSKGRDNGNSRS